MEEKKSGQKGVLQVAFLQVILKEVLPHYYSMQLSAHVQHFVLHCRSRVPDIHMNPHHPVMASKSPSITLKPRKWCENRRGGRDMNSQRKIPDTAYFSMYSMWLRYTYQVMMYTTISHFPHKVWSTYRIRDRSVWRAGHHASPRCVMMISCYSFFEIKIWRMPLLASNLDTHICSYQSSI